MKIMKLRKRGKVVLVAVTLVVSAAGCNNSSNGLKKAGEEQVTVVDEQVTVVDEQKTEAVVEGNTLTYGNHRYEVTGSIDPQGVVSGRRQDKPTAAVSFTNVPSDYDEFEAVYTALLGKSVQGAVAMVPMALELYARDAGVGERCLQLLCNSTSTVSGIVRILKTKLVPSQYGGGNDSYIQRYLPAALLKGATPANAYTPQQPYTVEMTASVNKPQQSSMGQVTYVYILAKGWDTEQRTVEVLLPADGNLYKVFNCPSCYTQCKQIKGTWEGLR